MTAAISIETPLSDDIRSMISELSDLLLSLTPADACHHLTAEQMAGDQTTVFVARVAGEAAACGALYRHGRNTAEVKRMFTRPGFQGQGLGARILDRIVAMAREEGFDELVLETGVNYAAARHLYERAGFHVCGSVLDYPAHPQSVFYSRSLSTETEI